MQSFTYKPALLRRPVVYEVTDLSLVHRTREGGVNWRMDWDQIKAAAFVDNKFRGNDIRRLDLTTTSGRRSIAFSGRSGTARTNPDSAVHLDLLAAILRKIEAQNKDFSITIGEYGRGRTTMFLVGVFTLLSAVGLIALAAGTGVSTDKMIEGAVPSGLMLLFGAVLCYRYRPGQPKVNLPAGLLAGALDGTLGEAADVGKSA